MESYTWGWPGSNHDKEISFQLLSTSSLIFKMISDFILQRACHTGGHSSLTGILCTTILLGSKDLASKCFRTSICNIGKP